VNGLVFYFDPSRHKPLKPRLSVGEVKGIFHADDVRHLGTGAGGETWLIKRTGTDLAVKMFTRDNYQLSGVDREIRGLQRGASRHVVRVERVEQARFSIENRIVIYFEFIDGPMLDATIRVAQWPTVAEVESFACGVLDGLRVLHANDVVHRDVKPANIALRAAAWDSLDRPERAAFNRDAKDALNEQFAHIGKAFATRGWSRSAAASMSTARSTTWAGSGMNSTVRTRPATRPRRTRLEAAQRLFVEARLTAAAERHGLALALPEAVDAEWRARPDSNRRSPA